MGRCTGFVSVRGDRDGVGDVPESRPDAQMDRQTVCCGSVEDGLHQSSVDDIHHDIPDEPGSARIIRTINHVIISFRTMDGYLPQLPRCAWLHRQNYPIGRRRATSPRPRLDLC